MDGHSLSWPAIIKELGRGATGSRDLDVDLAASLYRAMLAGEVPELELGAISVALRMKGESPAEMLGFHLAMQEHAASLPLPGWGDGGVPVVLPTYNGARKEANLTPLLALALNRLGVPVLLHGHEEDHGRVTSREILSLLGHPQLASLTEASSRLAAQGLALIDLGLLAPGLASLLALRTRLGLRSSAHSLVKMLDPFTAPADGVSAQGAPVGRALLLAAATHPDYLVAMRELLLARGQNALLLRACEGEAYANPRRQPRLEWLHNNTSTTLLEGEQGSVALPVLPADKNAETTARWTDAVLAGEQPLPPSLVQQCAACLVASGREEGMDRARQRVAVSFPV